MENQRSKTWVKSFYKDLLSKKAETETEICVFYANVLKTLFRDSYGSLSQIRSSVGKIRSYNNRDLEEHESVSFYERCDRFAYIFAYGAIHSVIMYDHFSNMLKDKTNMLKKITEMKDIRLCFLGGGPALEAAAVSKLFNNIVEVFNNSEREPLNVYATIVDICPEWEIEGKIILNAAQNSLCDSKNVQIHFNFIEADLTSDFTEDLRKVIKKAHIVTMCKFLSAVSEASNSEQEIPDMIHLILKCMSFKACLFYLDTSGGGVFNKMNGLIDNHESTLRIYGPDVHNCHMLSLDSIEKLCDSLSVVFQNMVCTTRCTISCSAWMKVDNCNTVEVPVAVPYDLEKHKLKEKRPKMKRVMQSAAKSRDLLH